MASKWSPNGYTTGARDKCTKTKNHHVQRNPKNYLFARCSNHPLVLRRGRFSEVERANPRPGCVTLHGHLARHFMVIARRASN